MEAPEPIFMGQNEPNIIKEFELELNKEWYSFKIGKYSNQEKIYFCLYPKRNSLLSFEGIYSLNDLCKINQSFRFFISINDLINAFDSFIQFKKILIEKNQNDILSLKIGILMTNFIGKEDKVLIDLKINELSEKERNKKLFTKIIELENKISEKDKEIQMLKNIISKNEKEKIKINVESNIVTKDDIFFIKEKLSTFNILSLELLYKCEENNNDIPEIFHKQFDGKKNILVFIETTEGVRFGGFTSIGFNSFSGSTLDNKAFLFSIDKKKIFNVKMNKNAIFCKSDYGPCFYGSYHFNICIYGNNFTKKACNTSKAKDNSFYINNDYELNNSKKEFFIKKLEVFQIKNNL